MPLALRPKEHQLLLFPDTLCSVCVKQVSQVGNILMSVTYCDSGSQLDLGLALGAELLRWAVLPTLGCRNRNAE